MPLLFYLPLIIWTGLFEFTRDEMRGPCKSHQGVPETRQ